MADFQPGDVFAGHRIEGLAGRGGMGVVYRATELTLDRLVALKLIAPALASDPDFRERFLRESKAAASIEHPNVLPIYYAGERDGELYIAMRYVDGQDLRTLVRAAGHLPASRTAEIVAQVASALDAAHERGLVHRDVKPANVLLAARDHAYLTDFGLAKRMDSSAAALSRPGGWVGTLGYVAPEQIRGERMDARADVYALGCVLVHALTGQAPYVRESEEATLWAHLHAPPPAEPEGVPEAFLGVVARALAKDPAERYPSAGDLGRAALAAAGRRVEPEPERVVATGAAAPDATVTSGPTSPVAAPEAPTAAAPTARVAAPRDSVVAGRPRAATPPRRPVRGARRLLPALGAVVVLAVAAVVAVLLLGGSEDPQTPDGSATSTSTSPAGRTFAATAGTSTAPVVQRPTAVAVAAGSVWATSYRSHRVVRMDAASLTRRPSSATIPVGTTDMTADGSSLWLVSEQSDTLTRVDARTGRVVGTPLVLPPGNPFAVAADGTSVWVGSRGSRNRNPVQQVLKVDKASMRVTAEIPVSRGVIDVAVGDDAVWVTNTRGSSVTRIAKRTAQQQEIRVGSQPKGVAVGGGGVWVANSGDGTVSRVDEGDGFRVATRAVGSAPQLITFGDGGAWVTLRDDSEVVRLDTRARVTARVPVETNPFALSIGGSRVYVASLYGDVVQAVAPEAG